MDRKMNSTTETSEGSLVTLKMEDNLEELPPRVISHTIRAPRFALRNVPLSPYILIDGKKLRSSLALSKKRPPRRVNFPTDDNRLIMGYLEPANPWKSAVNVNREDMVSAYTQSCIKHNTEPLETVISQLQTLDVSNKRNEQLNLKGQAMDATNVEPLEEILKRIQFSQIDLEGSCLDDETSTILFDMFEFYESTKELNISSNRHIGMRGWQACADMIRKSQFLEHLEANNVSLNEPSMNILCRSIRFASHLHVLKLESCGLSGKSINMLVAALKPNRGIRKLYLADNGLDLYDAVQLGSLLRFNNRIQLLDISDNSIQDDGIRDILNGLINQINEEKDGKGLNTLLLRNICLTEKSSPYFARFIMSSKTLKVLNIGHNLVTDELLFNTKDALKENTVLSQLDMEATALTCNGMFALSEILEVNQVLQRIDLRNNDIRITGVETLTCAMKKNKGITNIKLDDQLRQKTDESGVKYMQLVDEIRTCCLRNEQSYNALEESGEGSKVGGTRNVKGKRGNMEIEASTNEDDEFEESDDSLYTSEDDEIEELEKLTIDLEPQYQRYAKWRI